MENRPVFPHLEEDPDLRQRTILRSGGMTRLIRAARITSLRWKQPIWRKFYEHCYPQIKRSDLLKDIREAVEQRKGYALGKIGMSQKHWMYYEILLQKSRDSEAIASFEEALKVHGLKRVGIFPDNPSFYLEFNRFYMSHIRNLDCLGIFLDSPMEMEILRYYQLKNKLLHYVQQEPDRSSPSNDSACYLPFFQGKKLLIVCPFAGILQERATKEIFEGVWSKTGKKWFYPSGVEALEFPYGFSLETHEQYGTALNLYADITSELEKKEFEVALIGAGGLAIPIASYVKNMGKIGLDLGGHLQVLFGVLGERWRRREDWRHMYINKWWIDMPERYKPKESDLRVPDRSYW